MDADRARILLNDYYDGNTSADDECRLAEFFATGDIPDDMAADRELFMCMHSENQEVPDGLEQRLSAAIDRMAVKETAARTVMPHWLRWGSIAASVAIAFAVGYSMLGTRGETVPTPMDTCRSPEEAYAYAQSALVKVSECLNKGSEEVAVVGQTVQKIQTTIDRHITLN